MNGLMPVMSLQMVGEHFCREATGGGPQTQTERDSTDSDERDLPC